MTTAYISASAILLSAIISGICSYIITRKTTLSSMQYDKRKNDIYICDYASIVRLDIVTALFQSIRTIKNFKENNITEIYPLPFNKNYGKAVAIISEKFTLKEINHIYQVYGIIEKINKNTIEVNDKDLDKIMQIKKDYLMLLKKIYNNENKLLTDIDIDVVSYKEVIENDFIKEEYKETFKKLDEVCCVEFLDS